MTVEEFKEFYPNVDTREYAWPEEFNLPIKCYNGLELFNLINRSNKHVNQSIYD
jgi:hypothetical protein